jgi:GTPase
LRYKFVDQTAVYVESGKGGPGCVSFRREANIPRGGPDGGSGGRGGDVVIHSDPQMATLLDYQFKRRHIAKNGLPGEGRSKSGPDGATLRIPVPVGTSVFDSDTDELIIDLSKPDSSIVITKGGRGGKGNEHFKSSTRQAPRFSQPGEPSEQRNIRLELKLLADVGLIGFPNIGKSSLIARISAAKPKIADYPFTTLVPNLGVVKVGIDRNFVVADVPGLIVGAHLGAGLGAQFLRHVERVTSIVHMLTSLPEDLSRSPILDFEAIEKEMELHNKALMEVPRIIVLNKVDLPDVRDEIPDIKAYAQEREIPFFALSAATGEGIRELIAHLGAHIDAIRRQQS